MGTEFELENWITDKKADAQKDVLVPIKMPTKAENDNAFVVPEEE